MSYQVLARKWRPRRFAELVGQEHVVRALTHALDTGRIHHAFLFTGTRGVGKTTIARIFAKSLNCERGVSADPCGECSTCRDVDAGRFMDLLEIDAASNTGVDDVREVIENAQYRPARGNYKVYLIDEVHMLSKNAFNALLKTLEEPPEHAKFLLATTDPQKLPVTVLSRCLQFNLKRLGEDQIAGQLERIVAAEGVAAEPAALRELARAGNGSLRDALSLLDQAIAFGGGSLRGDDVRTMLGTIDRGQVAALLDAIAAGDGDALLARVDAAAEFVPDFGTVLDELAALLHRVQLAQLVPGAADADDQAERVRELAATLEPEDVQLLYQIAIVGRRDLALAPSPRAGFEMTLLRMLAFRPAGEGGGSSGVVKPVGRAASTAGGPVPNASGSSPSLAPVREAGGASADARASTVEPPVDLRPLARPSVSTVGGVRAGSASFDLSAATWLDLISEIGLNGFVRELAMHCVPLEFAGERLRLGLKAAHEHFRTESSTRQLAEALAPRFGAGLRIAFETLHGAADTAADHHRARQSERQQRAEAAIAGDPVVRSLIERFDARVVDGATRPVNPEK